jgi:hypothetical protein
VDYSPGESGLRHWSRQRPGNREDDWTAEYCAEHLIPALIRAGHCVLPLRALDPTTGQLDTTPTTVGPEQLPGLDASQATTRPRWLYNASVEGALRGIRACRNWSGSPWVHDPVAACQWEASIPSASNHELYLSIHQNWWSNPKMYGCNVLYYGQPWPSKRYSRAGKAVATGIWDRIAAAYALDDWAAETRIPDWRDRSAYRVRTGSRWSVAPSRLWEVRKTRRPAVLIELAFASSPEDMDRMQDPGWCAKMAEAIAAGIPV